MPPINQFEILPYLSIQGADKAVEFYSQVFEVAPLVRLDMPDGRIMHCEFRIGNTRFYLSEELPEHGGTASPQTTGATTVGIHLYVDDCDGLVRKMAEHGGKVEMEPTDMFWGERFARVKDPFGHQWGIATVLREMQPEEIQKAANELFANMDSQK